MTDPTPPGEAIVGAQEPALPAPASESTETAMLAMGEAAEPAAKGDGAMGIDDMAESPDAVAAVAVAAVAAAAAAAAGTAGAPLLATPFLEPPASAQKKKRSKNTSKVTGASVDADNNDSDSDDNNKNNNTIEDTELPSSSASEPGKKQKKKSAKINSPADDIMETATMSTNPEENGSNDASGSENRGDANIPRARGFTAVNLPVASAKPSQTAPEDPAMEQLLSESAAAAAAAENDIEGDATMDGAAPSTAKKQKRKRKDKDKNASADEGEEEQEAAASPQSAKKRRNKDHPGDLVDDGLPETQVPATQDNEQIDTTPEGSGNQGNKEAIVQKGQKKPQKAKNISTAEGDPVEPSEQAPGPATGDPESVPVTQLEDAPAPETIPPPPPLSAFAPPDSSSPLVTHTPKPKSKVAIAYERKRKRLEAAAAASSPAQAQTTADGGDGMDLDVPNEEDEDVLTPTPVARETPKSNKRKKRRMPDLNTPSRRVAGDEHIFPHSDEEEAGDGTHGNGIAGATALGGVGPSRTPRTKSVRKPKTPKTPKPINSVTATPQPGTTALSRKRASYTYAPNPAPATPPSTGTFTQPECSTIDSYLQTFAHQNQLSEKQLIARIWGDTSVVPTQTKAERESFWKDLYELFPHRKRLAIYNHVRRRYHNFDVQGAKWDEEQDAALARMVEEMGKKWTNIGRVMGRLPDDCRDRWRNYVKCGQGRREKEWTEEEEAKLREVVAEVREALRQSAEARGEVLEAEVEPNWTVVSEKMGGWRSRIQCRYKWSKMLEWEGKARLPDEEGGEGADGENGVRRGKTPRKRAPRRSTAAQGAEDGQTGAQVPAEDEVPIDPALADHTAPVAPMAHTSVVTPAAKKARAKKTLTASGHKAKSKGASAAAADGDDSDSITPLASLQMLTGDRIWLLESILMFNPETPGSIPWEELARKAPHRQWTARGLERAFGRIVKKGISRRDREGLGVVEGVKRLLGELEELPEGVRGERWVSPEVEEEEEEEEEELGEVVKKGKSKGKTKAGGKAVSEGAKGKRGRKPKAREAEDQEEEEQGGELRSAVRQAVESIKEREETEKFASLLLSSVQEAYAAQ